MEQLRVYVEMLTTLIGITGTWHQVFTHVLMVMVVLLLSWLSYALCIRVFLPMIEKVTSKTDITWDDIIFNHRNLKSACYIIPAVIIWEALPVVFHKYPFLEEVLSRITAIFITVAATRMILTIIGSLKQLEGDGTHKSVKQYFHTLCGVLKIVIIFISVIVMVSIAINRSPLTLFAGLGATSAVLMLVFKDTISGLVAGIRLTSNNMLHQGDWITVPKAGANGVVEEITLTTVKVRNFDNTIVTVTPQTLVDDSFQNWVGMQQSDGRRVKRLVYYDFHSIHILSSDEKKYLSEKYHIQPDDLKGQMVNLTVYRRYIEKYLIARNDVNKDMTYMVRQLEATNTGLPVEFYFFLKQKEWIPYEHHLAEIMEYIYAITPDFGLKIYQQYPEQ